MIKPLIEPDPRFRVRLPDITLPFGEIPPSTLSIATVYMLDFFKKGERYIGESKSARTRIMSHRWYVKNTGNINSRFSFSEQVKVTDLVCHVWDLDLSDDRYRRLHEFLLAFFFETSNIGKAGYGRSEPYGYTFVMPDKSEIHTFDVALFHQMYNIKPDKVKSQLSQRGITQHLALRHEVFDAYAKVFS